MHALLACTSIAAVYVAPFYLQRKLPRNHSATILFRAALACAACCCTWLPLFLALQESSREGPEILPTLLRSLGLRREGIAAATVLPVLLTALLFLGPLCMLAWDSLYGTGAGLRRRQLPEVFRDIVVGPFTEEFAFRACMAPLLLLQGYSLGTTVLVTPLFFGMAHLHHLYGYVVHEGYSVGDALSVVVFQFAFTTVFGWYATFLSLRTGHLAAPITAHAFCNWMGFPRFGAVPAHPAAKLLKVAFAAGILLFACAVRPLTDPGLYGNAAADTHDNLFVDLLGAL